jgi:hypothetical protein
MERFLRAMANEEVHRVRYLRSGYSHHDDGGVEQAALEIGASLGNRDQ